jgi:hypothetical protein
MKKHPVIKDERTEKLDGKVAGEIVLGMFLLLAISAFFKAYILHLSLLAYLPEAILLTLVGLYALLRRVSLGIDVRDMVREEKWPERFGGGVVFALILMGIDFFGQRESLASMLSLLYLLKLALAMILFTLGSLTMDKLSLYVNGKRQAKLDQELEDEE